MFKMGDDCVENCGNYYYQNKTVQNDWNCVNCKDKNQYIDKDNLENGCVSKIPDNYFYDKTNELYAKFGVIVKCHEGCASCSGISYDRNNQKCKSCENGYYLRINTNNCFKLALMKIIIL